MIRASLRIALAVALVAIGWMAARAQTSEPAFELIVNAPSGQTTIECVRGCALAWVERGLNPNSTPAPSFKFGCSGTAGCSSGKVGGWLKP